MTMNILEGLLLGLLLYIGVRASHTDLKTGYIYNRDLFPVFIAGIVINIIYYWVFVRDIFLDYLLNLLIIFFIQALLYGFHSFAGGDVKLGMLLAILYPARLYFAYQGVITTLFFAFGCSFIYGYGYLLISTVARIKRGAIHPNKRYFIAFFKNYIRNYLRASVYIMAMSMLIMICGQYVFLPSFLAWILNMFIAWLSSKVIWMQKKSVVFITLGIDVVLSGVLRVIPFSINPESYLFVAVLLICQMIISMGVYELIDTDKVAKGMILSTTSSILMQGSRVKGLPGISGENLNDRLTEDQASSVRRWGKTKNGKVEVTIVRKIPFAIFLLSGFLTYLAVWGILNEVQG